MFSPARLATAVLCSLVFGAVAPRAQISNYAIVPSGYDVIEGNSLDREPFGYDQIRNVQYLDRSLLGAIAVNTTLIKEIAYRRDGQLGLLTMTHVKTGTQPNWQVRLGNYQGNYLTQTGAFPTVSDVNYTTVYSAKPTVFPALNLINGGGPQNFDLKFLLDVPWQFKGPGIAIDHYCSEAATANYDYYIDAIDQSTSGATSGLISPTSVGCPSGQNRAYGVSASPGVGEIQLILNGAPTLTPAVACFGGSATSWNSLPLPYSLAGIGLAGCNIYADLSVQVGATTSSSGSAQYKFAIPANPLFSGAKLYGQWIVSDTRVNPAIPIAMSDGVQYTVGSAAKPAMTTVSAGNGLQGGGSGYVNVGHGYPVRFGW